MLLYNLAIRSYSLGVRLASPFSPKAKKWVEGRRGWQKQLSGLNFSKDKWVWFHCSSYGEFQDGRNLMEAIKQAHPQLKLLLTFFSPSGYEPHKNYHSADFVCYLPLDTPANASHFIEKVNPVAAFFIRHDVWPNYIVECYQRSIPAFLVSFTLNENSKFVRFPLRSFYQSLFQKLTAAFVQDEASAAILSAHKFNDHIVTAGNLRIDRTISICEQPFTDRIIEKFLSGNFCVLAGSTHAKDREIFMSTFRVLKDLAVKWVIVPHDIHQSEIEEAKKDLGESMVCYSEAQGDLKSAKVLWIDKVGILSKIYRYTDVVFVGGGFTSSGIHSIQEPAVYGCPLSFGPHHRGYKEALDLLKSGGAEIVEDKEQFKSFILKYYNHPELRERTRAANKTYMRENAGATERVFQLLEKGGYLQGDKNKNQ